MSNIYSIQVRLYSTDQGRSKQIYHTKRMQRLTCVAWTKDNRCRSRLMSPSLFILCFTLQGDHSG